MDRVNEVVEPFLPALERLENRNLLLASLEFEGAFATFPVPNQRTDTWAYLLGGYLACCYSLGKQPSQITAFDVRAFVESQDIGDVRKALLANFGQDLPPAAIDAASEYLLTVAGRNQITLRDTAAIDQAPDQLTEADRALARRRAEDYWRALILRGRDHGERGGALSAGEFQRIIVELRTELNQLNQQTVSQMSPENAAAFLATVDSEDQAFGDLYEKDHDAGYRRLGLDFSSPHRRASGYQRQSMGEMAARTVVRATIWESISLLLRGMFR